MAKGAGGQVWGGQGVVALMFWEGGGWVVLMGIVRDGVTRDKSCGKVRDVTKGSMKHVVKTMMTRREVDMRGGDYPSRPQLTKYVDKIGLVAGRHSRTES